MRWMFVRVALGLAGIGILIGLGVAAAVAQLMTAPLLGVSPLDHLSFAVVPFILEGAAAVASYLPVSRAAAVNPGDALKTE
jgi:ABC-type antimicrobial peptide transport system permease subunit